MESTEAEEDSSVMPEREEKAKSSAEEDAETLSIVVGADQLVGYIVHFTNVVKLYQRKIEIVSHVVVLTTSWKIVWSILARLPEKWV